MYLAEAKCMIGKFSESFEHLEQAENLTSNQQDTSKRLVNQVELKFRQIEVSNDEAFRLESDTQSK